jgi:hypothetical protein
MKPKPLAVLKNFTVPVTRMWGSLFPLREAMPFEMSRTLGSDLAQEPETETNP